MRASKKSKMSTDKNCGAPQRKDFVYPDTTTGSETLKETRKEGNHWSAEKRAELFDRGMQIIYGGSGSKNKVRSRH
jgi:hypothetical protein